MKIRCNEFVKRQTADSRFSHFDGAWEELEALVAEHFAHATPGYKDGVLLVLVPVERFWSGVVEVTAETKLHATLTTRRPGEDSYINVVAVGAAKLPAKSVEVVLYSREVLGAEASTTDADYEIASVNARPTEEPEPMNPVAMARNMLGRPGGSATTYTGEDFARAILYWQSRAMCG